MKIRVLHYSYGCETGCCGHVIEVDGKTVQRSFEFGHPDSDEVRAIVLKHIPKECHDSIDWEAVEVEDMEWC